MRGKDIYTPHVLDHYGRPRNWGRLERPDLSAGGDAASCGDRMMLDLALDSEDRVEQVGWEGEGCLISMACASIFSERVQGKALGQLERLTDHEVLAWYGIPAGSARRACALLPLRVLQSALRTQQAPGTEPGQEPQWPETTRSR